MPTCTFEKKLNGEPEELLEKAEKEITNLQGTFTKGQNEGTFSIPTPLGTLRGQYTLHNRKVSIEITEKPLVISCGVIENTLDQYLQNNYPDLMELTPVRDIIHWGDWKKDDCSGQGTRQYSSIIWGLDRYPREQWIGMCYSQPINNLPNGQTYSGPNRCVWDALGHVWGEVDVPDTSCGHEPYSTCLIASFNLRSQLQSDKRKNIEIEVALFRDNSYHGCPPNTPNYAAQGNNIKVIIQANSGQGTWKYLYPVTGASAVPLSRIEMPFNTQNNIICQYRPTNYQPGMNYSFSIWLLVNNEEVFFKEGGKFAVSNGKIVQEYPL